MQWKFELLMRPPAVGLTEGPAWDGEHLYFTHVRGHRILRYEPRSGSVAEWRTNTRFTNGLAFDAQGRLFGCCSGGRSLVRFDSERTVTIADRHDGKRLNTPNDLAIDRKGRIWFTNPWNERNVDPGETMEIDGKSVYRLDPASDGTYAVTRVTLDNHGPNGILVSEDGHTLYVAESGYTRGINRELRAYPILKDGGLGQYTTLFTWGEDHRGVHRGIDGMCLDAEGNIVAAAGWEQAGAGPMIYVISPAGRVLGTHPVPALRPTNCCFGGADMTTLFVTTTQGHLFKAQTDRVGWAIWP